MRAFLLCLLVVLQTAACADSKRAANSAAGAAPRPAAALALRVEVTWPELYAGDPLPLQIRLMSPRARRDAHLRTLARERGETDPSAGFSVALPERWEERLTLALYRVENGARTPVLEPGRWEEWREKAEAPIGPAPRIGDPAAAWWVPPESVRLTPGRYLLEVRWEGSGAVDREWLDAKGYLLAPEVAFEVRAPATAAERARQAERSAAAAFRGSRYQEARERAREALALDPAGALQPERVDTYLRMAAASLALNEPAAAAESYRALLARLPPPEWSDLAVAVQGWVQALEARGKTPLPTAPR